MAYVVPVALTLFLALALPGCQKSGKSKPPLFSNIPATMPEGAGQAWTEIDGIWDAQNIQVVEAYPPSGEPKKSYTLRIAEGRLVSFDWQGMSREEIERQLAFTLDWYINAADNRALYFGYGYWDNKSAGRREEFGLVAGAIARDRMLAEGFGWSVYPGTSNHSGRAYRMRLTFTLVRRVSSVASSDSRPADLVPAPDSGPTFSLTPGTP